MKILQVNYKMDIGGIESFLINLYSNIDRKEYEFIFLTYYNKNFDFEDEIIKLGGKLIKISNPNNVSVFRHIKEIYSVIKNENIDVVHCHTYFDSAYVMIAAKIAKVNIRIVHSHTTFALRKVNILKRIKWAISRLLINFISTKKLACSKEAGEALFKNSKFEIIPNGINFEKFYYNETIRKKYRDELDIKADELVIGHVGRFDIPKNHKFLIEILDEIVNINKKVKLVLVGSGNLENEIKKQVKQKKLSKHVLFLGNRSDVSNLLNCFDIFVFPSIYEGLPVSLVEVQANGLPSLVSSNVSKEIYLSECIEFFSIYNNPKSWAEKILSMNISRIDTKNIMLNSNYSINNTIKKLTLIYRNESK